VSRQHLEAAKLLVARGANVNAGSKTGSPLMAAVTKNKIEFIALLLANGADPNSTIGATAPIHVATKGGCLECVKALVAAGADVNALTTESLPRTPIHIARFHDNSEIAEYLMANGVVLPKPAPITTKMATANAENGQKVFDGNCDGCHSYEPGKAAKQGPNLWGVVGRDKASQPDAKYSKTLLSWEGVWSYEDLNTYLYGPILTTPGVTMESPGIPDDAERADLIAYLRTLSDQPIPLP
jgi:cytochrome c